MRYLMEQPTEGQRLLAQERANPSTTRLEHAGLRAGMAALDMGCGAGAVTGPMAALVGPGGSVLAVEQSAARLAEARVQLQGVPQVSFAQLALPDTGLESARFDFTWCQFVLEYFASPLPALAELVRLTRPGGKVVVSEIDGFGLGYWPAPPVVEAGKATFLAALERTGFDLFIGRKLFHYFEQVGLTEVRAHLAPFHLTCGAADAQLTEDWVTRFEALAPVMEPAFGGVAAYRAFADGYLALLADARAFKYSVILTVEGVRS